MQPGKLLVFAACMATLGASAQRKTPTVLLDYYFNNEWHRTPAGDSVRFHYTWEDKANSGFSKLGDLFKSQGFSLASLPTAPESADLSKASVYIIADPDIETENPHPHFISPNDVKVIKDWVAAGGVLVLMGNDKGNAEFRHFNQLSEAFGIHFNEDCVNHVIGEERTPGTIHTPENDPTFKSPLQLYMKDVASLRLTAPARPAALRACSRRSAARRTTRSRRMRRCACSTRCSRARRAGTSCADLVIGHLPARRRAPTPDLRVRWRCAARRRARARHAATCAR